MLGASALPFLGVGFAVVILVAMVQLRGFLRAVGSASAVGAGMNSEGLKCGFRVRTPSLFAVSFPLATIAISFDEITLCGPLGDYRFDRSSGVSVAPMRRTVLFHRIRVAGPELSAVVFVRDLERLSLEIQGAGWVLE